MKFLTLLLAASATATSAMAENSNSRGLASLAQKWNITDPTFSYTSLSFDLDYGVSDFITNGMAAVGIYDSGCAEGGNFVEEEVLFTTMNNFGETKESGDGTRTVSIDITVKPETITSDKNIYTEVTGTNGELSAVVTFCVRLSLFTGVTSDIEVNFHETLVTLNVQLTDGFSIDNISVEPREKLVRTANQVYLLEAFLCDENKVELDDTAKAVTRNQGAIIRVCVRPQKDARDDGIKMREIQSLSYSRANPAASQDAVVNSGQAPNGLSDLTCIAGDDVCVVETILTANFYTESGTVSGTGVGSMQFGSRRRALRSSDRALQQDAAGESQFDLDLETNAADDGTASGASSPGFFAVALLAFSGVLALL